jgi:hypothetical protein
LPKMSIAASFIDVNRSGALGAAAVIKTIAAS